MKYYIAIVLFLLSGCATTGSLHPGAGTKITVEGKSYDKVWDSSVAAVSIHLTVVKSSKDTVVIKAEGERYERRFSQELVGVFINPPTNSDAYTVEVVSLHGQHDGKTGDTIASELKAALGSGPETYGTIGLVSARFVPVIELNDVSTRRAQGSLKGAKKGAAMGAAPGAVVYESSFLGCSLGPGYTGAGSVVCGLLIGGGVGVAIVGGAVGAVVGGVTGAVKADSAETVLEQQAQAKAVLSELKIQETVRDRVEQYANKQGGPMFVKLSDAGPTSRDEEANYQSLAPQKIDTVLEITVTRLGMQTDDKYNSDINLSLAVFINARARLVRIKNYTVVLDRPYIFESEARTLSEWNAENGQLIAESLTQGYQQIAQQIYYSFF